MQLPAEWVGRVLGLVCAAATVVGVSGCAVIDRAPGSAARPSPSSEAQVVHDTEAEATGRPPREPAPVTAQEPTEGLVLRTRVTRVAGHLTDVRRERVARYARAAVVEYLEGAFAGGDHPFREFVPGLRREARADAAVLRGEEDRATGSAWFAVAAPYGRAVGIAARLAVEVPSDRGPVTTVTGRLLLTKEGGRWRVFGYDLARGER